MTASEKRDVAQTHRFLYYNLACASGADDHYIDLARDLSRFNRRLYRQGMVYRIGNITFHDSQGNCNVKISTAPNTWPTHEAWKKFFGAWKKQRAEVLSASPETQSPKWSDFKVYINKEHIVDGDWQTPVDDDGEDISDDGDVSYEGEWDYADISFNFGGVRKDNYAIGIMGEHHHGSITTETTPDDDSYDGYVSMLEGLNEIRRWPRDDQIDATELGDSILLGMNLQDQDGNEDILLQLADEGDRPPYPKDFVGSSNNPDDDTGAFPIRHAHIASQFSPVAQVGGFPVPCGLMQIKTTCDGANTVGMIVELVAGDYKGVSAYPMGGY